VPSSPPAAPPRREHEGGGVDRRLIGQLGSARRALVASVVVGLVTTVTVLAQMLLLARLLGWAMSAKSGPFPVAVVLGFTFALLARVLAGAAGEAIASSSGAAVTSELRRLLLEALVARGPVELVAERSGSLTLAATRGLRALEPYFSRYLPAAVVAALAPPLALLTLAIVDWPSALVALALVAIVPFAMIRLGRRAARESERQWRRLSSMSGRFLELLRGIPTLRALGSTERGRREVVAANVAVSESVDATLRAAMLSSAALEFLAGIGVGLVAMLAGLRLLHGDFTVAPALAVILVTPEVFLPLRRAGAEFHASTEGRAAASSVFTAIDAAAAPRRTAGTVTPAALPVVVEDLSAGYGDELVLGELSFELARRSALVVEGPSGAGKSSLLAVLAGFLPPRSGQLSFGGVSAAKVNWSQLREHISLVPQVPHVFRGSLRENLTLGLELDDDRLAEALEQVGLARLAAAELGGLDRLLDEAGRSISSGERQRLGLARAVVQDRELVLLDEPTAHLDEASIDRLRLSLAGWLAARCVVEVSHRRGLLSGGARLRLERAR
jgi:ATP-binding cassette subfamily C protein CydD